MRERQENGRSQACSLPVGSWIEPTHTTLPLKKAAWVFECNECASTGLLKAAASDEACAAAPTSPAACAVEAATSAETASPPNFASTSPGAVPSTTGHQSGTNIFVLVATIMRAHGVGRPSAATFRVEFPAAVPCAASRVKGFLLSVASFALAGSSQYASSSASLRTSVVFPPAPIIAVTPG